MRDAVRHEAHRKRSRPRRARPARAAMGLLLGGVLMVTACSGSNDAKNPGGEDTTATTALGGEETTATTATTALGGENTTATTAPGGLVGQMVSTLALTEGEAQCVLARAQGRLDEASLQQLLANPNAASPDRDVLSEVLGACSFANTAGSTLTRVDGQPFTYGDDPDLDHLWDQCSAEGTAVCDDLYNRSPERSEYEAFADTCGGRGPVRVSCAPDANGGSTPSGGQNPRDPQHYGDSTALDQLWDQCAGGDGQACAALAFQAPAGSDYATFGANCGDRPDDPACASG